MTLLPFSTKLLAAFITFRTALIVYWLNGLAGGVGLYCTWRYARRAGLIKRDMPADLDAAIYRRIVVAQTLYAFGALLCVLRHVLEHRLDIPRAAQLRHRAALALSAPPLRTRRRR